MTCMSTVARASRNEPANEKRVLFTQVTHKGSDKPTHKCSLARAFAVCRHVVGNLRKLQAKNACLKPKWGTAHEHEE